MKTISQYSIRMFLFAVVAIAVTACSEDERALNQFDSTPVILTTTGGCGYGDIPSGSRRAAGGMYQSNTGFDGGEQLQLYLKYSPYSLVNSAVFQAGTPDATHKSALTRVSGDVFYYPIEEALAATDANKLYIYGVYPATSTASHTVKYDQTNSTTGNANYKASDLMYATTTATWTATDKETVTHNLAFSHKLAKLYLKVKKQEGIAQITDVRMKNVKRSVPVSSISISDMTLGTPASATGETAADGNNADEILLSGGETVNNAAQTFEYNCIFVPQQWNDADFISISTDAGTVALKVTKTFSAGNEYRLTINVKRTELELTGTIGEWSSTDPLDTDQDISIDGEVFPYAATYPTAKGVLYYNESAQELITAASGVVGGNVKYAMTTTTTEPAKSAFTTTIPTATAIGTYYLWYYIEASTGYHDTPIRSVSGGGCTYIQRNPNDKTGQIESAMVGSYQCAKLYLNAHEGYYIVCTDYSNSMNWNDACNVIVEEGGQTFTCGDYTQWESIINFCDTSGSNHNSTAINTKCQGVQGWTALADFHWSSTPGGAATGYSLGTNGWNQHNKTTTNSRRVRLISAFTY